VPLSVRSAPLAIRPIEAADRALLAAFFDGLSEQTRYQRFLGPKPQLSPVELDRLTQLDHISRDALGAFEPGGGRLVAVARYAVHVRDRSSADIAITVADEWQGLGLGTALGRALVRRAAASGIARLTASVLSDNMRSRALMRRLGFRARGRDGAVIEFARELACAGRRHARSSTMRLPSAA
jgi:acetyltransferase